jgi:hypothetical protein
MRKKVNNLLGVRLLGVSIGFYAPNTNSICSQNLTELQVTKPIFFPDGSQVNINFEKDIQ